jgi:hypothetical protein
MSLRDELGTVALPGPPCSVGRWIATQPDPEWAELMADLTVQHSALARLARKHGLMASDVTFRRHRIGGCACARPPV